MNSAQTEATFDELEEETVVHIDKIAETLESADTVEDFAWDEGKLHVWINRGMLHSDTIEELDLWGVEIEYIQFANNHVAFTRKD